MDGTIRWQIRKDLPQVLEIEKHSFEYPWSEETMTEYLRDRNCIGVVFEVGKEILGYIIYRLEEKSILILKLAVRHDHRMSGIGKALIHKVINKLSINKRQEILVDIREGNLNAQLFFQHLNFMAVAIIDNCFEDVDVAKDEYIQENAYVFIYKIGYEVLKLSPKNRISKYFNTQQDLDTN